VNAITTAAATTTCNLASSAVKGYTYNFWQMYLSHKVLWVATCRFLKNCVWWLWNATTSNSKK